MTRVRDWPQRLSAVFEAAAETEFQYGAHDCCLHAAECADAVTGGAIAEEWRGAYANHAGGMDQVHARHGTRTLAGLVSKHFPHRVHPAKAHRGDIALARGPIHAGTLGLVLMVFDGAHLRGPAGAILPRSAAIKAWSVG